MSEKKGSVLKTVTVIMIIMFVGKAMGFARNLFHAGYYGTDSVEGTAFNYISMLPNQFFDILFASAISASFIPVFNGLMEKKGREDAYKLANNFISIILTATTIFTALCILLAGWIVPVFTNQVNPETEAMAVYLARFMFPTIVLSALAFSVTGILQSMGEFNIPAAMAVMSNGIIIFYYVFLLDKTGVVGLCFAFLLGWASQLLIQIPFLVKNNFRFHFHMNFRDESIQTILRLMLPVMVSTWVAPVNILVNSRFASGLYGGSGAGFNAITYASNLYTIIAGVFVLAVCNVVFPELSRLEANQDREKFSATLVSTLRSLFFILVPMSLGMMALATPIIQVFYQRGRFDVTSTFITAQALFYFSAGILGYGLQNVLSRAFYAMKDGKTPLLAGIAAMAVNFVFSWLLSTPMGAGGPALASSLGITTASIIMLAVMGKKKAFPLDKTGWLDLAKMLGVGLAMFFVVSWTKALLDGLLLQASMVGFWPSLISLGLSVAIGMAAYAAGTMLLGVPETKQAVEMLKQKLRRHHGA